ncbi:predicted protein [Chaetomium globosum CBS 148.51]|uniref:Uncharacterized protein n=1 Tax=Chaetomium globosum (strain ATCC 6205 / CBS 148.51 / DSM 1962 / NBRC 6347 / NRRL 1970) TaxID=306901 RepID=Q2GQ79_CHAGB|nr:uncharacterized protein CHGG_09875 [Chaetomium globosum CBS 148.51]EAQ83471.1 predicted protein [Chaetomium globosum CBS 148.51]
MPLEIINLSAIARNRTRMAARLGFESVRDLESWEEEIVLDHFANFICDYLAMGYTVEPDKRELVSFINLDESVEERIKMLEERRFEMVLDPDKSEWTAKDHYKQFVVGVVADDIWLGRYGVDGAILCTRDWTPKQTTLKMVRFLEFLVQEWVQGPGDATDRQKSGQMAVRI